MGLCDVVTIVLVVDVAATSIQLPIQKWWDIAVLLSIVDVDTLRYDCIHMLTFWANTDLLVSCTTKQSHQKTETVLVLVFLVRIPIDGIIMHN